MSKTKPRYDTVKDDERGVTILFDREKEDAWIESNAVCNLTGDKYA